jgi:hypothetical protein
MSLSPPPPAQPDIVFLDDVMDAEVVSPYEREVLIIE